MPDAWQPGTLYQPGAVVIPATTAPVQGIQPANPDFAAGDTGWLKLNWAISAATVDNPGFNGSPFVAVSLAGGAELESQTYIPTSSGQLCAFDAMVRSAGGPTYEGDARMWPAIRFYDGSNNFISQVLGGRIKIKEARPSGGYRQVAMSANAPPGAASFRPTLLPDNRGGRWLTGRVRVTSVHVALSDPIVYTAVQPSAGFSGATEPAWPGVVGQQVVDNEVTWEALDGERVVWTARRILVSGADEPEWPGPGSVVDNTILWQQDDRRVTDSRAPNSKIVALAASKIFAGDDDIVPYSATVNPLDWTTREDAGYLPFGLQNYGSLPVSAMGLFEGNLVVFNAVGHQVWQVDEDPASMALLSAKPVGSIFAKALQPVMNDLLFLTKQGVRSLGVAGASTNLEAGDVGKPIDILVQEALRELQPTVPGVPGEVIPAETVALQVGVSRFEPYWVANGQTLFSADPPNPWTEQAHLAGDVAVLHYINGHNEGGNAAPWNGFAGSQPAPSLSSPGWVNLNSLSWGISSMGFYLGNGIQENVRPIVIGSYFSLAYAGRRWLRNVIYSSISDVIQGTYVEVTAGSGLTLPGITIPAQGGIVFIAMHHHLISDPAQRAPAPDSSWTRLRAFTVPDSGTDTPVGGVWFKFVPGGATGDITLTFGVSGVKRGGRLIGLASKVLT